MKQSERVNYARKYENSPLKSEYELNKKIICQNKPASVYFLNFLNLFFLGMFFFWGWCFFSSKGNDLIYNFLKNLYTPIIGDLLLTVFCGVANVFIWLLYIVKADEEKKDLIKYHNKSKLEKLDMEYIDKGLYPMPERELFEHECCEYDDRLEDWVCSATKEHLPYSEVSWCKTPGNCRYCKRFVTNYLGPDRVKYWGDDFKK